MDELNNNILSSAYLKEQPTSDFKTLKDLLPRPTTVIPENSLTNTEQKEEVIGSEIQKLNKQLIGEAETTAKLEKEQKLPEMLKTQTDLQSRLNLLTAEQNAIPLQIQQESIGRGRTVGGVAPIETSRLRENAINALSTSALLQATQGNISTAQTLVDRAVAEKYNPIREKIKVQKENLQMIIDSPQYSKEQKDRATKQKSLIDKQTKEITKKEAEEKAIMSVANETAKFGASVDVLQAIKNAGSELEAIAIAQTTGLYNKEKMQQEFENSLKTGEFNLKKQEMEQKIKQQAVDNNLSLMNLELDRDKYSTDTEFKNAQLVLDKMKTNYDVSKIQADIDKVYDDISRRDDVTVDDLKKINDLEEAKDKKKADEIAKNVQLGNEYTEVNDFLKDLDGIINSDALSAVVGTGLGNKPLKERLTGGWLKDSDSQWLRGKIHQLTSRETLNTLLALKEKGGTLGAISEKELAILENSATIFADWEKKETDKNGNLVPTGAWNVSESRFKEELNKIINSQKKLKEAIMNERLANTQEYSNTQDFETFATDEQIDAFDAIKKDNRGVSDDDILDIMNEQIKKAKASGYGGSTSFNEVGGDTNKALPEVVSKAQTGEKGGQCGRFVNKATGLGLGDSYQSKMAKMDPKIKKPEVGMVFTMPYQDTGHTGFIVGFNGKNAIVKDSNWGKDEKVKVHEIPLSKITGYARV